MQVYRAFVVQYSPTDHLWHSIAWMRVLAFDINQDALARATSTIKVLQVPEDVSIGDVVQVRFPDGSPLYAGVIEKIEDTTITCSQIHALLKGEWVYQTRPDKSTPNTDALQTWGLTHEVAQVIWDYCQGLTYNGGDQDMGMYYKLNEIGGGIYANAEFITEYGYGYDYRKSLPTDDKVMDFEDFLYSMFENYTMAFYGNVLLYSTGVNNAISLTLYPMEMMTSYLTFSDNSRYFRNFEVVTTKQEVTKLTVYSKDGEYRANYYLTVNGVVTDSTDVGRIYPTITKIVYSDDELDDIVASNMPDELFDHQIRFDLDLINPYYSNILNTTLGRRFKVMARGYTFDTILTGRRLVKEEGKDLTYVTLICGKARTSLTKKLLAQGVI